jgi:hypothetical protein
MQCRYCYMERDDDQGLYKWCMWILIVNKLLDNGHTWGLDARKRVRLHMTTLFDANPSQL